MLVSSSSWRRYLPSVVLFFAVLSVLSSPISALAQSTGVGIGLSPATIEEGAEPGETKQYTVNIANLSETEQVYYLYVRDIVGVTDEGVPQYAQNEQEKTRFELSSWVTLGAEQVTVPAGAEIPYSFVLKVPEDAEPGSHFGAIFVTVDPPRMRTTGAAVGYEVANIISIRVAGDAVEQAEIRQFSTDRYLHGSPNVDFTLRVENLGNVLVRPTGPLEITNMFGKQVASLTFNESQAGVFPGVTREFKFNWKSDGIGFGRYEARVSPVYGDAGRKSTISSTATFWILPMNIIGPAVGILLVLLAAVYFGVRYYVKRTVAMMGVVGQRRIIRQRRSGSPILLLTVVSMLVTTALFLLVLLILFA